VEEEVGSSPNFQELLDDRPEFIDPDKIEIQQLELGKAKSDLP